MEAALRQGAVALGYLKARGIATTPLAERLQFRYIANRRARQLGLAEPYPGAENLLPWLDEQANLRKEKNFFETRVTEYQTGGALSWE